MFISYFIKLYNMFVCIHSIFLIICLLLMQLFVYGSTRYIRISIIYLFRSIIHFSISSGVDKFFIFWYRPVLCCILICFSTSKGCAENVHPSILQTLCVFLCSEKVSSDEKSLSHISQ